MSKDREFTKFVLSVLYSDFLNEHQRYIEKVVPFERMNYKSTIEDGIHFTPKPESSYLHMKYHHSEDFKMLKEFEFEDIINNVTSILKDRIIDHYKRDKMELYLFFVRFPIIGIAIGLLYYFVVSDIVAFSVSIILCSILILIWIAYSFYRFKSRVEWEQFYLINEIYLNSLYLEETKIEDEFYNQLKIVKQYEEPFLKKKIDWNKLITEFKISMDNCS